jgi:hypothetical protein
MAPPREPSRGSLWWHGPVGATLIRKVAVFSVLALTVMTCGTLSPAFPWNPSASGLVQESAPPTGAVLGGEKVVADPQLEALWANGRTLEAFVADARQRKNVWEERVAEARIPRDVAERVAALEGRGPWRLLVVAADRCLDSAFNIPPMDRLALFSDALDLRVVTPEEGGRTVMEARPTSDGRAATPTVVILDERGDEVGCWIERPTRQRVFFLDLLKRAEEGSDAYNAAVQNFLGWYREDNGATTLRELVRLLEAAANGARGCVTPGT